MAGGKRKQKDPDAPKPAWSAYFFFCDEFRDKVKGAHPDYSLGEVAKELGRMWRESKEKPKYEARAAKDKERFQKEMAAYKAKCGGGASAPSAAKKPAKKPAAKAKVDDDDDDDE